MNCDCDDISLLNTFYDCSRITSFIPNRDIENQIDKSHKKNNEREKKSNDKLNLISVSFSVTIRNSNNSLIHPQHHHTFTFL